MARLQDVILRDTRSNQPAATTVAIGTLYFVTDESVTERSNGTTWQSYSGSASNPGWIIVAKSTDTSRASDATSTPDPDLQFSVLANTKYVIKIVVGYHVNNGSSATIRYTVGGPASPMDIYTSFLHKTPGNGTLTGVAAVRAATYPADTLVAAGGDNTQGYIEIDAFLDNGANAGTFSFNWGQAASNAAATLVLKGSYIMHKKL